MKPIKYTEKIIVFFPTLNSFSFQFTKYAQLFMDFLFVFFSIPLSFIKMPAINSIHGVSLLILVLIYMCNNDNGLIDTVRNAI